MLNNSLFRNKYSNRMEEEDKRILDFKSDILTDAELFIADLEFKPDIESLKVFKSPPRILECEIIFNGSAHVFPLLFFLPIYNKKVCTM